MTSRQDWAATFIEDSGAASGSDILCPGGKIGFVFSGTTVTDVDIETKSIDGNYIPTVSALTTVAAKGLVVVDLPPGVYRATVVTGTAVDVRAAKVPE